MHRCPKGCFSHVPFDCVHGGSGAKNFEPTLKGGSELVYEFPDEFDLRREAIEDDMARTRGRLAVAEERGFAVVREFEALQRAHDARMRQGAEEDQRTADRLAKARLAPVGYGCPVPRYF